MIGAGRANIGLSQIEVFGRDLPAQSLMVYRYYSKEKRSSVCVAGQMPKSGPMHTRNLAAWTHSHVFDPGSRAAEPWRLRCLAIPARYTRHTSEPRDINTWMHSAVTEQSWVNVYCAINKFFARRDCRGVHAADSRNQ